MNFRSLDFCDDETNTPINKGKMFISSTSPPAVLAAYLRQFQRDFRLFTTGIGSLPSTTFFAEG